MNRPASGLRERIIRYITKRQRIAAQAITLHRRRIYILPTRYGYMYAFLVFIMLLGSINYGNSMGFMLTFLLAGMGANVMWQTYRNLLQLRIVQQGAQAVYAGQYAQFALRLENDTTRARYALYFQAKQQMISQGQVDARRTSVVHVSVLGAHRGRLRAGRFAIFTRYPLNLFHAWSWLEFDMTTLVYPKPIDSEREMPAQAKDCGAQGETRKGSEDYNGLRGYQRGDSPRQIAWKTSARADSLFTKLFSGEANQEIHLDWLALAGLETELRLSILCRWVLDAETRGLRYALSLPNAQLPSASGEMHKNACLKMLALYAQAEPAV